MGSRQAYQHTKVSAPTRKCTDCWHIHLSLSACEVILRRSKTAVTAGEKERVTYRPATPGPEDGYDIGYTGEVWTVACACTSRENSDA